MSLPGYVLDYSVDVLSASPYPILLLIAAVSLFVYIRCAIILVFGEPTCGWKQFLEDCDNGYYEDLEACRCPACGFARYSRSSECLNCHTLKRTSSDTMCAAMDDEEDESRKRRRADARQKELMDRKQILESTQDMGLRAFMDWNFQKDDRSQENDARNTEILSALNAKADATRVEVEEIKSSQQSDRARIARLEDMIKQDSLSQASGSTRYSRQGSQGSEFQSTYVEAHGWVQDWTSRATMSHSMLTDVNATHLLTNLLKYLETNTPDEYKCIEVSHSQRLVKARPMFASVRIKFTVGTDKKILWAVQESLQKWYDDASQRSTMFTSMTSVPTRVRFRVEAPPWKLPHIQAVGRFFGVWSKVPGADNWMMLVTGSGKSASEIWGDSTNGARDHLGSFVPSEYGGSGQWEISTEAWNIFKGRHSGLTIEAADLQTRLKTRVTA